MVKDTVLNIVIRRKMETKHQKPMKKEHPDSYLSDKAKFLKKNKNLIDREVKQDESNKNKDK